MSKIVTAILMSQAPERPKWFEGKNIPEKPKEPSKIIDRYSDLGDVVNLLKGWVGDPNWDLDNTYQNKKDYPKGVDILTFEGELNKFAQTWEEYWESNRKWEQQKQQFDLMLDIQWRVYWAKEALKELNNVSVGSIHDGEV